MLPHQIQAIVQPERFNVLVWHRRARKSSTAIEKIRHESYRRKGIYWHVFPTRKEAKDAIWKDPDMMFRVWDDQEIEKKNESELTLYLKNGSMVILHGADEPDRLRGSGPIGVVLDEFGTMKYEVWNEIIQPILRANDGWCWFIGTPKGKNHFYQIYIRGLEGGEWWSTLLRADKSGIIQAQQLENAKADMPLAAFNQEFLCEWLEGEGQVFRNVSKALDAIALEPIVGHSYVMGVDLAKHVDWTVISVMDRETNSEVYLDRFQTLEWPFQKARIKAACEKYGYALTVIDSTGIGDVVADDLAREIGDAIADDLLRDSVPIKPFQITSTSKKLLIEKLSVYMEQQRVHFLPDLTGRTEFENFGYEILPSGNIRYGAPEGFHDDIVIARALAVYGLFPVLEKVDEPPKSLISQTYTRVKEAREKKGSTQGW